MIGCSLFHTCAFMYLDMQLNTSEVPFSALLLLAVVVSKFIKETNYL